MKQESAAENESEWYYSRINFHIRKKQISCVDILRKTRI